VSSNDGCVFHPCNGSMLLYVSHNPRRGKSKEKKKRGESAKATRELK
jgi:hypothetical protein